MSIAIRQFVGKNVSHSFNKHLYTVSHQITPYTIQLESYDTLKSSVVTFSNKIHAIRFAHLLEEFHERNYIWPQLNIDNTTPNILFCSKYNNLNEDKLNDLYIDEWNSEDILSYCKDNIFNILMFEENSDNYNIIKRKFQIMYKVKLYNIESSIEKQRYVCEEMYQYL